MPKNENIQSILILGSGPIVIGQACEFDYSGVQACKALRQEGYRCILVNSNPATIMTDPSIADRTYIEPLTVEYLSRIIEAERPDAILTTVGGQTALNLSLQLDEQGILSKYGVQLLGADAKIIRRAESRKEFKEIMQSIGLQVPHSKLCQNISQARNFFIEFGLPLVIRSSFTLGGTGGGIVRTENEFVEQVNRGLAASLNNEIIIEKSLLGWNEFELELMRDHKDNVIVVCSIENLDPMGIHTGDSITICPQQTLSDKEYQRMRNAAIRIIRSIGVETGGANIQFAINPQNRDLIVVEMNPRVSRSSALASKATGFPIARVAALLAVGYHLNEITNTITKTTPCSFEPVIDYIVTKLPYFTFQKFPGSQQKLGTAMRSVGEAMGIGRTFKESLQKGIRSLEKNRFGLGSDGDYWEIKMWYILEKMRDQPQMNEICQCLLNHLSIGYPERIFDLKFFLHFATRYNIELFSLEKIHEQSKIHEWFLYQIFELIQLEEQWCKENFPINQDWLVVLKENGYSDRQLAYIMLKEKFLEYLSATSIPSLKDLKNYLKGESYRNISKLIISSDVLVIQKIERELIKVSQEIREKRHELKIHPVFKTVDTCAGEFASYTPYHYSTYEIENENNPCGDKKNVLIIGAGPNRIGQGIEFDYCCCHAAIALREIGYTAIICNSNPETVSTDYDSVEKLFFDPIQAEEILEICRQEKPKGIILSFGGQSPLHLLGELEESGYPILGLDGDTVAICEDRKKCSHLLEMLNIGQPRGALVHNMLEAKKIIKQLTFPLLIRPSYVLGGQDMAIVYDKQEYLNKVEQLMSVQWNDYPILIDEFLENAIEIDVDAISDREDVFIAGIMQHVEQAGIHSGDSSLFLPPLNLNKKIQNEIIETTRKISLAINICGPLNLQFALSKETLYVLEINPRASRTLPFVSKAIGVLLPQIATKIMCGEKLKSLNIPKQIMPSKYFAVKASIFPFARFPGSKIKYGPEMKSTGETMGIAYRRGEAYLKALIGAGEKIPAKKSGVLITINDASKSQIIPIATDLKELGYRLYATKGTATFLSQHKVDSQLLYKKHELHSPNTIQAIRDENKNGIRLVINIFQAEREYEDAFHIREECLSKNILCITTIAAAQALVMGLKEMEFDQNSVTAIQDLHYSD